MTRRYNSLDAKNRILSASVKMFIEKGYGASRMLDIIKDADVSAGTFQNIFHTKDGVLQTLAEFMFDNQFAIAKKVIKNSKSPVYFYATETAIQLAITELDENLREIYVEAYSNQKIAEYIYQRTSSELRDIFGDYLPNATEGDFYELDIGTCGLMRAYMSRPCDKYFTLQRKTDCFLGIALSAYNVPEEEKEEIINYIRSTDILPAANAVIQELFKQLSVRFDFVLSTNK